ncbi:MAG TPA: hypothetical protein ENJ01_12225 [Gammaproteobacteria bacterium]|nr:hypothetical protein [Gammaproteobacteria bacterium]
MHRMINFLYSGFLVGVGLGTVFQLCILPVIGMRAYGDWTDLLNWGLVISLGTGVVSAISFWFLNAVMVKQGK